MNNSVHLTSRSRNVRFQNVCVHRWFI